MRKNGLGAALLFLMSLALVGCSSGPVKKSGLINEPIVLSVKKAGAIPSKEQFVSDVSFNIRKSNVQFDSAARGKASSYANERYERDLMLKPVGKLEVERAIREQVSDADKYVRNYPHRNSNRSVTLDSFNVKWLDEANGEASIRTIDRWTPETNPYPYSASLALTFKVKITDSSDRLSVVMSDFSSEENCWFDVPSKGKLSCTFNPSKFLDDEFFANLRRMDLPVQTRSTPEAVAKDFISINRLK